MVLKDHFRLIPDFPQPGIMFIDITTVLQDPVTFAECFKQMQAKVADLEYDVIVGSESRGFIMGAPLALASGKGFVPVRKPGKLPYRCVEVSYDLEYGSDTLQMHEDAIKPGQRVLIVDDLLATGGTAAANCRLIEKLGGTVAACLFLVELTDLNGKAALEGYQTYSIVQF